MKSKMIRLMIRKVKFMSNQVKCQEKVILNSVLVMRYMFQDSSRVKLMIKVEDVFIFKIILIVHQLEEEDCLVSQSLMLVEM